MQSSKSRWLIPAILVFLVGGMLHFLFDLLLGFAPAGAIAAVNESVWEHMKLAYWPMLVLGALACTRFGYTFREWAFPLAKSITVTLLVIPLGYYFILCGLGIESLVVDILLFLAAIFTGFCVLEKTFEKENAHRAAWGTFILAAWGVCFIVFTFFPPHIPLFLDVSGGFYGIPG